MTPQTHARKLAWIGKNFPDFSMLCLDTSGEFPVTNGAAHTFYGYLEPIVIT